MSEVSTWDPVDDNNTAAPPAGWPEGQSPASVNNCARAMMGAIRRWYDTITAAMAQLPFTYLKLTGGTIRDGFDIAKFDTTGTYNQSGSWIVMSDARLKHSVQRYDKGLQAVLALKPVRFKYRGSADPRFGLMAQDVAPVVPEMVGEVDGFMTLSPTHTNYLLINACKELAARVEALEGRR